MHYSNIIYDCRLDQIQSKKPNEQKIKRKQSATFSIIFSVTYIRMVFTFFGSDFMQLCMHTTTLEMNSGYIIYHMLWLQHNQATLQKRALEVTQTHSLTHTQSLNESTAHFIMVQCIVYAIHEKYVSLCSFRRFYLVHSTKLCIYFSCINRN